MGFDASVVEFGVPGRDVSGIGDRTVLIAAIDAFDAMGGEKGDCFILVRAISHDIVNDINGPIGAGGGIGQSCAAPEPDSAMEFGMRGEKEDARVEQKEDGIETRDHELEMMKWGRGRRQPLAEPSKRKMRTVIFNFLVVWVNFGESGLSEGENTPQNQEQQAPDSELAALIAEDQITQTSLV